jgi:hypothetical protein
VGKGRQSENVSLLSCTAVSLNGASPAYSLAVTLMRVAPLVGGALMSAITVKGFIGYLDPANSYGAPVLGIPVPVLAVGGVLALSVTYMVIWRIRRPEFFTTGVEDLGMACADDARSLDIAATCSPIGAT